MSTLEPTIRIIPQDSPADDYRVLAEFQARRTISFFDAYKKWRNRARRYDLLSILNLALDELQRPCENQLEAARRLPAITCLIVKWVLQDSHMDYNDGRPPVSRREFELLRQSIWEIQDQVDLNLFGRTSLQFSIRRMFQPQIEFQARMDNGMFRDAGLLHALPPEHPLRTMCRSTLGVELENFVGLSLWLISYAEKGNVLIPPATLRELRGLFPSEEVSAYFRLIAPTLRELRARMRSRADARRKVGSELFETPALSHAPLLLTDNGLHIWHPTLIARCLEVLVHRRLASAHSEEYILAFSKVFDRHVVAQAERLQRPIYNESTQQRWFPRDSKVVEAVVDFETAVVLVEAKAGLYDEEIMSCGDQLWLSQNTKPLRVAIEQLQSVAALLAEASDAIPELRRSPVYGMVVTNLELRVGSAARLESLYPPGKLDPRTPLQSRGAARLPLDRIYIMGVATYDRLTECVARKGLDMPAFFAECVAKDAHGHSARLGIDHHLTDAGWPALVAPVSENIQTSVIERVHAAVGLRVPEGDVGDEA